ncbi:hypothetical protein R1flu_010773 [Riccia fluitans]|uniref:Uncharacterized protein n=1 Tax=Riccia fluitans TaxID=41844 RepID=A0ABD1Z693_9MARC
MRTANALDGKGGNQVWHKLKVIFDDLDETEKTIFLDLATFDYYGPKKEKYDLCLLRTAWSTGLGDIGDAGVMRILTISIIENLRDRCFLEFDGKYLTIDTTGPFVTVYIHPALRNMGKWISRQLSKGRNLEDSRQLLELNEGGTEFGDAIDHVGTQSVIS